MSDEAPASSPAGLKPDYRSLIESRRAALRAELDRFLRDRRLITLEVGCGHGHFLTAYAHAHPDKLCIGIDLAGDRIERALRKRDRARLGNLHFLQAEARLFLDILPQDLSLEDTYVLFPDPWPKLRHNKHRIMQADFLATVAARTPSNGRLIFRTDHRAYFEAANATVRAHPAWEVTAELWPFEYVTVFQSRAPEFHSLIARRRPLATAVISASTEKKAAAN